MNPIQNTEVNQNESNNDSSLAVDIQGIDHWGIPDRKTRKQWYQSTNPQIRSYITGNLVTNISGKGARSLKRASDEYQYLSEDLARNSYSSKAMSKKYDKFNGIDSSLLDRALENENKQLDTYQQQFNTGQLSERKFNRLQQKHGRRINNLNENYQTLSEVWHNKHDVPLVRTQSSVSPAPFLLGTIGLPAAIIGGISGGIAAAPYIGKALANPWVQRGLTGLDVVDTGVQVASGNYLGAATNWIPYDDILKYGKKAIHTSKDVYKTYKQNKLAKQYIKNIDNSPDIYYRGKDLDNRMSASLQNIYSRDRYIENNLEYGPTQRIVDSSLENSMLINGSNVATGVTPKEGGIVSGSSRPHFENGYYVPAKGNIQFQTGETLAEESHPIFFSPNKPFGELPHGKSFTSTYQQFYPDDINNPNTQRTLNPYRKFILDKIKTSDNVPYRFVETPYKSHLNAKPRETGTSWGIEVHVPKVPIEDIRGHEYDPLLKTFRKHLYVDPNTQTSMINPILESLDIPYFKNGSGIHIKKENRGKFN